MLRHLSSRHSFFYTDLARLSMRRHGAGIPKILKMLTSFPLIFANFSSILLAMRGPSFVKIFTAVYRWIDRNILELGRELRLSYLPPLMVYMAAGISGLTSIVGTFFVKEYLGLPASFLAALGFWAGIPWALKMPLGAVLNRAGNGDSGVHSYLARENIPLLLEIPMDRKIAEAYSRGQMIVDVMPEWKEKFKGLYQEIERIVNRQGNI